MATSSSFIVSFIFIGFSSITIGVLSQRVRAPISCANWRDELDDKGKIIFIAGDRSLVIPSTIAQVDTICSKYQKDTDRIRAIGRACLRPFPKQVLGLLIYGSKNKMKQICGSQTEKEKLITMTKCIRDSPIAFNEFHVTVEDLTNKAEFIRDNIPSPAKQSSLICCHYHDVKRVIRKKFPQWCPQAAIDYTIDIYESMLHDAMDLVCYQERENSPMCLNMMKNEPLNMPSSKKRQSRSILLPLTDIYTSLGDHDQSRR